MSICVDTILLTDPITIALLTSVPKIVVRFSTVKKNYFTDKFWIHKLRQDYNVTIKESTDWYALYKYITYSNRYQFNKGSIGLSFYQSISEQKLHIVKDLLQEPQVNPSDIKGEYLYTACMRNNPSLVKMLLDDPRTNLLNVRENNVFIESIKRGRIEAIKAMICHPKIDPTENEDEAIYRASESNQLEILKLFLVDTRICPNRRNNEVLRVAASWGHVEIVKVLLKDLRVDPTDSTEGPVRHIRMGPLQLACNIRTQERWSDYRYDKGQLDVIKLLLDDPRIDPSVFDDAAMRCATETRNIEAIKLLLSCPKFNVCSDYNQNMLILSCKENDIDLLEMLMADKRFDPSYNNNKAIKEACSNGRGNVVKILLKDSRINPSDNENIALKLAVLKGYSGIVELLLGDHRINNVDFDTLIWMSISGNHIHVLYTLLSDPRIIPIKCDMKLIKHIISEKRTEIIALLLSSHKFNISSDHIEFMLFKACEDSYIELIKLLLSDSRLNLSYDSNLLIEASRKGWVEIVEILLSDSRIYPSNNKNKALSEASTEGHVKIVELLLKSPRLDIHEEYGSIFLETTIIGHFDIIKILLADSRKLISNVTITSAIDCARIFKHMDLFKYLSIYAMLTVR